MIQSIDENTITQGSVDAASKLRAQVRQKGSGLVTWSFLLREEIDFPSVSGDAVSRSGVFGRRREVAGWR